VAGDGQRIIGKMRTIEVGKLQLCLEDCRFERHADPSKRRHYPMPQQPRRDKERLVHGARTPAGNRGLI